MSLLRKSFVLIRHGQTDANRDGRIAGRIEAMLTQEGRTAAQALGNWIWPEEIVLFASPQRRALETAGLAFPDKDPVTLDGLRERDWGVLEGCPLTERLPRDQKPDGGEAWPEMLDRVAKAISSAQRQALGGLPVLVAHSGVIRAARHLTGGTANGPSPSNTTPYLFVPHSEGWRETMPNKKDCKWTV